MSIPSSANDEEDGSRRHRPAWRTKQQIANHLGVSVSTIDRYRALGLPCSKRSRGVVRFDEIAVDAWFGDEAIERVATLRAAHKRGMDAALVVLRAREGGVWEDASVCDYSDVLDQYVPSRDHPGAEK